MGPYDTAGLGIYEAKGNVKTAEKNWEQAQIIGSGFRKQYCVIRKSDQTSKGQFGQFILRGDSWPICPLKYLKLKLWKTY